MLTLIPDSLTNSDILILKASIAFKQKKYSKTINLYNQLLILEPIKQDKVLWLQALVYIKNNQSDKAKENLNRIIDEDYRVFVPEAKRLLESLE